MQWNLLFDIFMFNLQFLEFTSRSGDLLYSIRCLIPITAWPTTSALSSHRSVHFKSPQTSLPEKRGILEYPT